MTVVHLAHEKRLLLELKDDTVRIIRSCTDIAPIKKLIHCHDIIQLSLDINDRFPAKADTPPLCDVSALSELRKTTSELYVYYGILLPMPDFNPWYVGKVDRLLSLYGLSSRS